MTRWLRTSWRDDDGTDFLVFWEVGADGWVTRSVELADRRLITAAALDETLAVRDAGRLREYEAIYGILPEAPLDFDFPHDDIPPEAFEERWREARAALGH